MAPLDLHQAAVAFPSRNVSFGHRFLRPVHVFVTVCRWNRNSRPSVDWYRVFAHRHQNRRIAFVFMGQKPFQTEGCKQTGHLRHGNAHFYQYDRVTDLLASASLDMGSLQFSNSLIAQAAVHHCLSKEAASAINYSTNDERLTEFLNWLN